jgi:hypothetical protein
MAKVRHATPPEVAALSLEEIAERCIGRFRDRRGDWEVFEEGRRMTRALGPWECVARPPGVIHRYQNESLEPVYFHVMLSRGRLEAMGYADDELYRRREAHLSRP